MKIYQIWFIQKDNVIFVEECSCVEKKQTYLVKDSWYVKKDELNKLNDKWEYMYSLNNNEETLNLFRKLLKEKYDEELRKMQEKISSLENARIKEYKR